MRRFAGWLLDVIALDRDPKPRQTFACAIGWHRLRLQRRGNRYVFACDRVGCPERPFTRDEIR